MPRLSFRSSSKVQRWRTQLFVHHQQFSGKLFGGFFSQSILIKQKYQASEEIYSKESSYESEKYKHRVDILEVRVIGCWAQETNKLKHLSNPAFERMYHTIFKLDQKPLIAQVLGHFGNWLRRNRYSNNYQLNWRIQFFEIIELKL